MTSLEVPIAASGRGRDRPERLCAHCGLDVPRGLIEPEAEHQFCCVGCRSVFELLRSAGLDAYYTIREADGAAGEPVRGGGRRYAEFDDPTFLERHAPRGTAGLRTTRLHLDGVHCAACVWLIEKLPRLVPGVREARLDFRRRIVRIVWDDSVVDLSRIGRRLASIGYPPRPAVGGEAERARRAESRRMLVRVGVAGAIAGNVMLIAFALYGGMFHGIDAGVRAFFEWTSLGLTAVALAWPGNVFFRSAVAALRARTPHMDIPIAVGLSAGAAWSAAATVRGTGDVYFDSLAVLVFLLLVGRWIEGRQQRASADSVELLYSLTPRTARLVDGDDVRDVPVDAIRPGEIVEVRAGDSIPADGRVESGRAELNCAWLTGESRPTSVGPGDVVHAGTVSVSSRVRVRVETTGEQTRVGQLMQLVEQSAGRRGAIVRMADRIAGRFVVVVLLLAVATVLAWWRHDPDRAVAAGIAVLIVTCPCALGLATPLALVAAVGRAARAGILIKGGRTIECLRRRGTILLDKTGTVTTGHLAVAAWEGRVDLKPMVAAIESHSAHPVACALARDLGAADVTAHDVAETPGGGVEGRVGDTHVIIGCSRHLARRGVRSTAGSRRAAQQMARRGLSPVLVAVDDRVEAVIGVGDAVRPDAARIVAEVTAAGWTVGLLSGDDPEVVRAVGAAIGIDPAHCRGGVDPEAKLRTVEEAARRGTVVMVGDGVNDAAALAAATVGVAVRGGAEASLSAADVYLGRDGIGQLPDLLEGGRRTIGVVRRNLVVSLLYNVVGAGLAVCGLITPPLAAVLMPFSSLTVTTLSYRADVRRPAMSVIYVVLPIALCIAAAAVLAFLWAVRSGQFDDVDTPAVRMLHDEEAGEGDKAES